LPDGDEYRLRISIGVAVYPDHGVDATALLTIADAAMYADKLINRPKL
jgi:GGDEF domain-containing protein